MTVETEMRDELVAAMKLDVPDYPDTVIYSRAGMVIASGAKVPVIPFGKGWRT